MFEITAGYRKDIRNGLDSDHKQRKKREREREREEEEDGRKRDKKGKSARCGTRVTE